MLAEWQVRPSQQQQRRDVLALLLLTLVVTLNSAIAGVLVGVLAVVLIVWQSQRLTRQRHWRVGYQIRDNQYCWWIDKSGQRAAVLWQAGSVRRADVIILCWSFWPWNRLILRRDSFASEDEFRQLKAALYGSF